MKTIPLPAKPEHQRFADLRLAGKSLNEAYTGAGYKPTRGSASNAKRIEKRDDVKAYMTAVRQQAAQASVMDMQEKRLFFARIVRTPITAINMDDPDDPNHDIVKKFKRRVKEGNEADPEAWIYDEFEKLDPLKAIELDNRLDEEDPETKALDEMAKLFSTLRNAGT